MNLTKTTNLKEFEKEEEEERNKLLTGLLTNIGCCVMQFQAVETQISILMNHLGITKKGEKIDWIKDGKSLGQRIEELNKNKILPEDFKSRIDKFRNSRNEVIHGLINNNDFSIFNKKKIAETYLRTRELRVEAYDLVYFFNKIVTRSIWGYLGNKIQPDINSIQSIMTEVNQISIIQDK